MKIALFGGSFDPPHLGHMAIIEAALERLDIDRLYVVPAYLNPFKSCSAAPAALRLKWLQKSISDPRVVVSDFEVSKGRSVPTIETLTHFAKAASQIYLIIGADNLERLHEWYRFDELNARVTWVVATREGTDTGSYAALHVNVPISSTQVRQHPEAACLPHEIASEIIEYYKEHSCNNA